MRAICGTRLVRRWSAGSVSGSHANAAIVAAAPTPASITKMPRQPVTSSSRLPSVGRDDRAEPEHEREPGEEPGEVAAAEQVADHRPGDDDTGGAGEALHRAQHHERLHRRRHGARERRHGVDGRAR